VTIIFSPDRKMLYVAATGPDMIIEVDLAAGKLDRRHKAGAEGDGLGIVIKSDAQKN
jgi:sugar lactone lactonase YvrE